MAHMSTENADDTYGYGTDNTAYAATEPPDENIKVDLDTVFADLGIFFIVLLVCCPFVYVIGVFVKRRTAIHPDVYLNTVALARHLPDKNAQQIHPDHPTPRP